jgi:hypothetical protein
LFEFVVDDILVSDFPTPEFEFFVTNINFLFGLSSLEEFVGFEFKEFKDE